MTRAPDDPTVERADAARNRARLLEAAARLVAEQGAEHVTMNEVAQTAGVGKGTLFRRFGDRTGLLLTLLGDAEAEFCQAYTCGPPPLGPGAPPGDRLTAFGCALIERITDREDLTSRRWTTCATASGRPPPHVSRPPGRTWCGW